MGAKWDFSPPVAADAFLPPTLLAARVAHKVDTQNADDKATIPMVGNEQGAAYPAACDLVLRGWSSPAAMRSRCCMPGG